MVLPPTVLPRCCGQSRWSAGSLLAVLFKCVLKPKKRVLAHYFSITRLMGPARGFTLFYRFPMILSLRYVRIRLLSFHFVWTLGVFENLLRAFSDCVSVCISAPTITGAGKSCVSKNTPNGAKPPLHRSTSKHVTTPSRHARALCALRHALRCPLARRSPVRRRHRQRKRSRRRLGRNMRTLTATRQRKHTRADTGEFSPEATLLWWSTQ